MLIKREDLRNRVIRLTGHGTVPAGLTDVRWEDRRFDEARLVLRNVHLRPGVPPVLVAAPVDVTLVMSSNALDDLLRFAFPRLSGHVDDDGVARLRWARRPERGWLEVDVEVDGSTLWLHPRVLRLGRRRWRLPARMPTYPVRLPELAEGLTLTDLSLAPGRIHVSGSLAEWRAEVPRTRVEDVLTQLSALGRPLNLTRRTPGG